MRNVMHKSTGLCGSGWGGRKEHAEKQTYSPDKWEKQVQEHDRGIYVELIAFAGTRKITAYFLI